jgi:hypothetical protein
MSGNVGASTSRNPKGLHGLYRDNFTFTSTSILITHRAGRHSGNARDMKVPRLSPNRFRPNPSQIFFRPTFYCTRLYSNTSWRRNGFIEPRILHLCTHSSWVVSMTPRPLYPRRRPGTHLRWGLVGLRTGLDDVDPTWTRTPISRSSGP